MLIEELTSTKGHDLLVNHSNDKSPSGKLLFKEIGNNQKKITSVSDWTSYCRNKYKFQEMVQGSNFLPGRGLLPREPNLFPVLTGAALTIQAAAQLLTYDINIRAAPLNASPHDALGGPVVQSPRNSAARYAQNIITHIDGAFSSLVNGMLPWDQSDALPVPLSMILSTQPKLTNTFMVPEPINITMTEDQGVEINNTTEPSGLVEDRRKYIEAVFQIKNEYPELTSLASAYLRKAIREKYALEIDPDTTYFNRFNYGSTSSKTFTGWEHTTRPVESKSLTERLLENFGAEDQINSDALSANSGIYTEGARAEQFGKNNEVRLLPKDFLDLVIESNFSYKFLQQLKNFWRKNRISFRTVSKGLFITLLGQNSGLLSEAGLKLVTRTVLGDIASLPDMSIKELEREVRNQYAGSISTFDIYGYPATDIYLIHGNGGKIVLYQASGTQSFVEFESTKELIDWVLVQARDPIKCEELANHFSLYDRQEGHYYPGVDSTLQALAKGKLDTKYLNYHQKVFKGDLFTEMMHKSESRTLSDAHILTTTNGEVFKEKVLMNLRAAANMAGVVTVVLPAIGSLSLLGIGIIQTGLGINDSIYGDTERRRKLGLSNVIDGGVNTLFGLMGANIKTPAEEFSAADNEIDELPTYEADEIYKPGPSQADDTLQRGTFINRLFKETVVRQRGLNAIKADNLSRGWMTTVTFNNMEEALQIAEVAIDTPQGREIAARYLGYDDINKLAEADIQEIKMNIQALKVTHKFLVKTDKSIKTVSIFGPRGGIVNAYYNEQKNVIAFTDRFFSLPRLSRLRVLLHECMHASVKEGGKSVPDYFYLRNWNVPEEITAQRNEQLQISRGNIGIDYFIGKDGHMLREDFMRKMGTKSMIVAGIRFHENGALKRSLLLKNPDTQAIMIMELASLIPETTNIDDSMRLPWEHNNSPDETHLWQHSDNHPGVKEFLANNGA